MEEALLVAVKEGSPFLVLAVLLGFLIYTLIKERGSKDVRNTSSTSSSCAPQSSTLGQGSIESVLDQMKKYISLMESKEGTTSRIFSRVDLITENLLKINENLAHLNGMLSSLQKRVDYLEMRGSDGNRDHKAE